MPLDDTSFAYTTTEPSLEGLLAFCESRPADEEYCWINSGECLLHQYAESIGSDYRAVADKLGRAAGKMSILRPGRGNFELTGVPSDHPHTFGAAAARCRSLLAGRPS